MGSSILKAEGDQCTDNPSDIPYFKSRTNIVGFFEKLIRKKKGRATESQPTNGNSGTGYPARPHGGDTPGASTTAVEGISNDDIKIKSRGVGYATTAHVCVSSTQEQKVVSQEEMMRVVVAPWSFSVQEAQDRLERARGRPVLQTYDGEDTHTLLFGDVEGLWDPLVQPGCLNYVPTQREEERLGRLFYGGEKYSRATELPEIYGRGRYRCKRSMGPERWNSFVERERGFVKEHVTMLREHWGRNFFNRCSIFVADGQDITSKSSESQMSSQYRRRKTVKKQVEPHAALNIGIGIETLQKDYAQHESLRAKHAGFGRPKTAHDGMDDVYDTENDFRIGVRPFSS